MDPQPASALLIWQNAVLPALVACAVLCAAAGIGMSLLRLAASGRRLTGFELSLAPALGLALTGYLSDLVFMTGSLDTRPVYVALAVSGLALFVWQARGLTPTRPAAVPWPDRVFWFAGWMVIAWFGWKLFVGNVTPVNESDSIYHYAYYSRLLSSGATFDEILLLRNFPTTDLNRIIQHVYAMAGTLGGDGALHMVNFLFIASIAWIAQGVSAGVLRVSHWSNPLPILAVLSLRELIYTGFSAKVDYGVALFELAALCLFMTWRDRRTWILAVGLALALCGRTNSLRFAAVIPAIWLIDQVWDEFRSGGLRAIVARTLAVGAGTFLLAAPPYAMQQAIYGNPFYPMLNGTFGAYRHYYDWVILEFLQYRTEYGWLSAPAVYASMALKNLVVVPGVATPANSPWGLSALMLLAPLAFRRDRYTLWLLAFVGLGYLTWFAQTHTHRTLLSVAVLAVVLAAAMINRLRRAVWPAHFVLFAGVITLASWTAYDFLGFNSLVMNYHYVEGRWSKDDYHDLMIRRLYPGVIPDASEVAAISGIVGTRHLASIDLTPFAHPSLIRTRRLMIPGAPLAAIASDETAESLDRRIAQELLGTPFIVRQAQDLRERLWPAEGPQRPLSGGADLRWYLTASHDAWRYVSDWIAEDPRRLAPLLRFEGVEFVLASASSVFGVRPVEGLAEVWRSDAFVLLRVEEH